MPCLSFFRTSSFSQCVMAQTVLRASHHFYKTISTFLLPCATSRFLTTVPQRLTSMAPPTVVFVLGGPGSGKGTMCTRAQTHLGFVHISAGDCLREERNRPGAEYCQMINEYIKEGRIVPVEITCALLRNKMKACGWENGKFLIDGFPRNLDNLNGWNSMMADVNVALCLSLECPFDVMEKRLLDRGAYSGRVDDNLASIQKRFTTFTTETLPIIKYFQSLGKCSQIESARSVEDVWADFKNVLCALT